MRTARTIGIKEDGSEVIIHPSKTPIGTQVADFRKMSSDGLPKSFASVEFQTSDGKLRRVTHVSIAAIKLANDRADEKAAIRQQLIEKQKANAAALAKAQAAERQKQIDKANAAKEAAKKAAAGK